MTVRLEARGETAELYLYDDIGMGGVTAREVAEVLRKTSARVVTARISSYGGDAFEGVAIHSLLTSWQGTVNVVVDGVAASAASIIAMAGEEIRIVEAGFVMIHDARGIVYGTADDMRRLADQADALSERMAGVYAAKTGRSVAEMRDLMRAETWFDSAQSLETGLCTRVIMEERVAARFDPSKHGDLRVPAHLVEHRLAARAAKAGKRSAAQIATERMSATLEAARYKARGAR